MLGTNYVEEHSGTAVVGTLYGDQHVPEWRRKVPPPKNDVERKVVAFLHAKASKDDVPMLKSLVVDSRINPNRPDANYWTALFHAARSNAADAARFLLDVRADVNLGSKERNTPLMEAARLGHVEMVELLCHAGSADMNKQNRGGATALMLAVISGSDVIVSKLVEYGAKLNLQKDVGYTALMLAARRGMLTIVKVLVTGRANLEVHDDKDETALMKAHNNRQKEVVDFILARTGVAAALQSYPERRAQLAQSSDIAELHGQFTIPEPQKDGAAVRPSRKSIGAGFDSPDEASCSPTPRCGLGSPRCSSMGSARCGLGSPRRDTSGSPRCGVASARDGLDGPQRSARRSSRRLSSRLSSFPTKEELEAVRSPRCGLGCPRDDFDSPQPSARPSSRRSSRRLSSCPSPRCGLASPRDGFDSPQRSARRSRRDSNPSRERSDADWQRKFHSDPSKVGPLDSFNPRRVMSSPASALREKDEAWRSKWALIEADMEEALDDGEVSVQSMAFRPRRSSGGRDRRGHLLTWPKKPLGRHVA